MPSAIRRSPPPRYGAAGLPAELRETAAVHSAVEALRAAVHQLDAGSGWDVAAAAWHAEPVVRFFCAPYGGAIAGVRGERGGYRRDHCRRFWRGAGRGDDRGRTGRHVRVQGQHSPRAGCDCVARYAVVRAGPGRPAGECGGAGSRRCGQSATQTAARRSVPEPTAARHGRHRIPPRASVVTSRPSRTRTHRSPSVDAGFPKQVVRQVPRSFRLTGWNNGTGYFGLKIAPCVRDSELGPLKCPSLRGRLSMLRSFLLPMQYSTTHGPPMHSRHPRSTLVRPATTQRHSAPCHRYPFTQRHPIDARVQSAPLAMRGEEIRPPEYENRRDRKH